MKEGISTKPLRGLILDEKSKETLRRIRLAEEFWASGEYSTFIEAFYAANAATLRPTLKLIK